VHQEVSELSEIVTDGKTPSELALIKVAGVLLSVEDSLDDQLVRLILPTASLAAGIPVDQDHEFRQVSEAVLRECIVTWRGSRRRYPCRCRNRRSSRRRDWTTCRSCCAASPPAC